VKNAGLLYYWECLTTRLLICLVLLIFKNGPKSSITFSKLAAISSRVLLPTPNFLYVSALCKCLICLSFSFSSFKKSISSCSGLSKSSVVYSTPSSTSACSIIFGIYVLQNTSLFAPIYIISRISPCSRQIANHGALKNDIIPGIWAHHT